MLIKLSEIAGFSDNIVYSGEGEILKISHNGNEEIIDFSDMLDYMVDIEYESEYFNSLRPIVSAHRDGEGELCLEVLWGYRGTDDKLEDMKKEWNRSEELWPKLYQNQTIS